MTEKNCNHSQHLLRLDIVHYSYDEHDNKTSPWCDQCQRILGYNACSFHCQLCFKYTVCLKCRSPNKTEVNDLDVLKTYVLIDERFIFLASEDNIETLKVKQKYFQKKYHATRPGFLIISKSKFIDIVTY